VLLQVVCQLVHGQRQCRWDHRMGESQPSSQHVPSCALYWQAVDTVADMLASAFPPACHTSPMFAPQEGWLAAMRAHEEALQRVLECAVPGDASTDCFKLAAMMSRTMGRMAVLRSASVKR
jgi:hypothetical protein